MSLPSVRRSTCCWRETSYTRVIQTFEAASDISGSAAQFDVLLACDVLYEDTSVDPVAEAVPRLLYSAGGRLVLADPTHRTEQNRCHPAHVGAGVALAGSSESLHATVSS